MAWHPCCPPRHAPAVGLAGWALGVFGTGRAKLSVLEAGLKVKADVKLPLQRMLAASLVEQVGFTGAPGTALLEAGGVWGVLGAQTHPG